MSWDGRSALFRRPRAPEVVVDGNTFKSIRRREMYEDLIATEPV